MRNAYDILSGEKNPQNCIYSIVAIMANMHRRPTRGKKTTVLRVTVSKRWQHYCLSFGGSIFFSNSLEVVRINLINQECLTLGNRENISSQYFIQFTEKIGLNLRNLAFLARDNRDLSLPCASRAPFYYFYSAVLLVHFTKVRFYRGSRTTHTSRLHPAVPQLTPIRPTPNPLNLRG